MPYVSSKMQVSLFEQITYENPITGDGSQTVMEVTFNGQEIEDETTLVLRSAEGQRKVIIFVFVCMQARVVAKNFVFKNIKKTKPTENGKGALKAASSL